MIGDVLCLSSFLSLYSCSIYRPSDGRKLQPQDVDTNTYMDSVAVVDNVLVMKARTGGNGVQMCLTATVTIEGGTLLVSEERYCSPDNSQGTLKVIGETITVQNADKANVTMTSETTFRHEKPEMVCLSTLAAAAKFPYSELRHQHISDYQSLFSTVHFSLGSRSAQNHSELKATSDLMKEARAGVPDVSLITLYYQYARYLLISSSRSGPKALPANLQGIVSKALTIFLLISNLCLCLLSSGTSAWRRPGALNLPSTSIQK